MPLQIQDLIVPEYTAVLTVPATAETITEAALSDMAVGLGNRIAYLLETFPEFSQFPEKSSQITDDFIHADCDDFTDVAQVWHGDTPWKLSVSGDITIENIGTVGGAAPGVINLASKNGTGGVAIFSKFASNATQGMSGSSFLRAVCRCRAMGSATNRKFEFGMQTTSGGIGIDAANSAALSFLHDPAVSLNWQVKTSAAAPASATYEDTGVLADDNDFDKLEIRTIFDPTFSGWEFLINDVVVVTRLTSDGLFQPHSINDKMQFRFAVDLPDLTVADEEYQVDLVSLKMRASDR